jgi:hypothetical protein
MLEPKNQNCSSLRFSRDSFVTYHRSIAQKLQSKRKRRNDRFLEVPPTVSNQEVK